MKKFGALILLLFGFGSWVLSIYIMLNIFPSSLVYILVKTVSWLVLMILGGFLVWFSVGLMNSWQHDVNINLMLKEFEAAPFGDISIDCYTKDLYDEFVRIYGHRMHRRQLYDSIKKKLCAVKVM